MTRRALVAVALVIAGCSRSPLPAVDFPTVPRETAQDARYGVVTSHEATVTLKAPGANGKAPVLPLIRTTELWRVLVTGDMPETEYVRQVPETEGCYVVKAEARLASRSRDGAHVNALAGMAAAPSDPSKLAAWRAGRPGTLEMALPRPSANDVLDFYVEQLCTSSFDSLPPVIMGASMPAVESRLTVVADAGYTMRIVVSKSGDQLVDPPNPVVDSSGTRRWTIRMRDIAAYEGDSFSLDPQQVSPWVQVVVSSVAMASGERKYADAWSTIAARVREAAIPASPVGTPDGDLAKTGSAQVRFRKLRERIATRVSRAPFAPARAYLSIPPGQATPFEAAAAIVAASSDTPDRGHIALVTLAEGPPLVDDVPSLYPFRAALVATRGANGWVFDDPTCSNCPPGRLPSDLAGGRAFVVTDVGYEIAEVPFGATETSRSRLQMSWNLDGDALKGSVLADFEGGVARKLAAVIQSLEIYGSNGTQALSTVSGVLFGASASLDVTSIEETSPPNAEPYEMRLQVAAKTDAAAGALKVPVYRVAGPWVPWLTPVSEARDVVIPGPLRSETTATIIVPHAYNMAKIADTTVRKTVGEYTLRVEQREDTITITRRVGLFTRHIPRERFSELRELVLAAADADAQVLELDVGR